MISFFYEISENFVFQNIHKYFNTSEKKHNSSFFLIMENLRFFFDLLIFYH
jgi:hypothetical protein